MADKGSTGQCGGEDWLIVRNAGPADAPLAGYMLTDSKGRDDEDAFTFANGTVLAAGAELQLCKDADGSFEFGIGGTDTVSLWDAGGAVVKMGKLSIQEQTQHKSSQEQKKKGK